MALSAEYKGIRERAIALEDALHRAKGIRYALPSKNAPYAAWRQALVHLAALEFTSRDWERMRPWNGL